MQIQIDIGKSPLTRERILSNKRSCAMIDVWEPTELKGGLHMKMVSTGTITRKGSGGKVVRRISVSGYDGTPEELQRELALGLNVLKVSDMESGKGFYVEYTAKRAGGRPPKYGKEQLREMRAAGQSYGEIAKTLGCSKTYVIKVCQDNE